MSSSIRDKAAGRAVSYREEIQAAQTAGDYRRAMDLSIQWLRGELAKVRKQRPQDAQSVDAELTQKISALAEAIPFYRPRKVGQ